MSGFRLRGASADSPEPWRRRSAGPTAPSRPRHLQPASAPRETAPRRPVCGTPPDGTSVLRRGTHASGAVSRLSLATRRSTVCWRRSRLGARVDVRLQPDRDARRGTASMSVAGGRRRLRRLRHAILLPPIGRTRRCHSDGQASPLQGILYIVVVVGGLVFDPSATARYSIDCPWQVSSKTQ